MVTEELNRLEALIASLEESDVSETTDLDALKAEINSLEERIQQLKKRRRQTVVRVRANSKAKVIANT